MAGRIPQAFLDDLLARIDIVEVIDRRVKLKKAGKNYTARAMQDSAHRIRPRWYGPESEASVTNQEALLPPALIRFIDGSLETEKKHQAGGPGNETER